MTSARRREGSSVEAAERGNAVPVTATGLPMTRDLSLHGRTESPGIRPHMLWQIQWLALALGLTLTFGYLAAYYPITTIPLFSFRVDGVEAVYHFPFLQFIPLILLVKIGHSPWDRKFVFTPRHLVQVTGLLSRKRSRREISYRSIKALNDEQNWWGRLSDTGEVQVGMSLKDLEEIKLKGVFRPYRIQALLEGLAEQGHPG